MHPIHALLLRDLKTDLREMVEQGHRQPDLERELCAAEATGSTDALVRLQEDWWNRPSPPDFPYVEPDDLASISATFPAASPVAVADDVLADRLLAAWRGRCVGCQLGKPLEGLLHPEKIRSVLTAVGSWPLRDYMNPVPADMKVEQVPGCDFFQQKNSWRSDYLCKGRFDHVAPDDDIHYAIISQLLLAKYGPAFTSQQAADHLVEQSPLWSLYAAGRNLYRTAAFGVPSPYTAVLGNPCRQSLGAMIRCDPFGWAAAGNPALTARMAYKDAINSQRRNGIYAGIFFAVLMADVLSHGDIPRAIDAASGFVPPRSRFAEMIRFIRERCADPAADWWAINQSMQARWRSETDRFNHSIPNGAIVLIGLLLGRGDFTRTLGITVGCGVDTDCTGATAGSIMGCALGTRGIPLYWTDPFHDTIRSDVRSMHEVKISDLARRLFEIAKASRAQGATA